MRIVTTIALLLVFMCCSAQRKVSGTVVDDQQQPLVDVILKFQNNGVGGLTDEDGRFELIQKTKSSTFLYFSNEGFVSQRQELIGDPEKDLDLGIIIMETDLSEGDAISIISLNDDELDDDEAGVDNISGLLQASKDVFLRAAAFEFSSSFFKMRGQGSEEGALYLNGVKMNKIFDGRPDWGIWGGLNDVMRNQEFSNGLNPSEYGFGGLLGTTNTILRASKYRSGSKISYATANRSYTNRVMGTYNSGLLDNGWAFTASVGKRWGDEGFVDGTFYDAYAMFASVEKNLNEKNSLNLTAFYAPNQRGKYAAITQEVADLKGIRYNEYWGNFNGDIRNSRVKRTEIPMVMLNHYLKINSKTTLNSNVALQLGSRGNSRIDFGDAENPSPTYWPKLPSSPLRFNDLAEAYRLEQAFLNDGQLDWDGIYRSNRDRQNNPNLTNESNYILYEDKTADTQLSFNTILNTTLNDQMQLNASLGYRNLKSQNYGEVLDLLGGQFFRDIDFFDAIDSDLNNPNRTVREGDRYKYNYDLLASEIEAFAQLRGVTKKVDYFVALNGSTVSYQRDGLYEYAAFEGNSFGKGEKQSFTGLGAKGGVTYKLTGRHLFGLNAAYITAPPSIRNTYTNSRYNHNLVPNIKEEQTLSAEATYTFRSPIVKSRLTGYYTTKENGNDISFFYAEGLGSEDNSFIQEIVQGVEKRFMGAELGVEIQAHPTLKLKLAGTYGVHTYNNNPNVFISSANFQSQGGTLDFGQASLKDYRLANGPQQAYSFGFEYRDPKYWMLGVTGNFFDDTYIDPSPLLRTQNFFIDTDGLPINDVDLALARQFLKQEEFGDYFTLNAVAGKSWRLKNSEYVGFFGGISNILGETFRTGGYEQSRTANYNEFNEDFSNPIRRFAPKYWYGRGTTFFVNTYVRF